MIELRKISQSYPVPAEFQASLAGPIHKCWICNKTLAKYGGGDPSLLQNIHHVIPRAYGGADGPTVSLDTAHHDLLHLVAVRMMTGQQFDTLLVGLDKTSKERLLYLSTRVVVAAQYVEGDPNKRVITHFSLNKSENDVFTQLADFHGLSKVSLLKKLLAQEYRRCFPTGQRPKE